MLLYSGLIVVDSVPVEIGCVKLSVSTRLVFQSAKFNVLRLICQLYGVSKISHYGKGQTLGRGAASGLHSYAIFCALQSQVIATTGLQK